jgi:hypothetical protein
MPVEPSAHVEAAPESDRPATSSLAAAVIVSYADAQSVLSAVSSSLSYFAAQVKLAATFSAPAVPVNFGYFG